MGPLPLELLLSVPALALLGLMIGSFLNVVAHRWPAILERQWWHDVAQQLGDADSHRRVFGEAPTDAASALSAALLQRLERLPPLGLARPASRCPACSTPIRWYHNLPVLSWLALRARCAACGTPIAWRYPLVELATALLFAAVAWQQGPKPVALLYCGFVAALLALSLIDWDTTVLPDDLNLPLLWAGLIAAGLGWTVPLPTALWGAVAGYLTLWSVYWLFKLATGKEGMGQGDFKLLAALGAWLGWQALLPIVLAASVIGAVVGIGMKSAGTLREGRYVPFGPFLAGAGMIVLLVGSERILNWIGWT